MTQMQIRMPRTASRIPRTAAGPRSNHNKAATIPLYKNKAMSSRPSAEVTSFVSRPYSAKSTFVPIRPIIRMGIAKPPMIVKIHTKILIHTGNSFLRLACCNFSPAYSSSRFWGEFSIRDKSTKKDLNPQYLRLRIISGPLVVQPEYRWHLPGVDSTTRPHRSTLASCPGIHPSLV